MKYCRLKILQFITTTGKAVIIKRIIRFFFQNFIINRASFCILFCIKKRFAFRSPLREKERRKNQKTENQLIFHHGKLIVSYKLKCCKNTTIKCKTKVIVRKTQIFSALQ